MQDHRTDTGISIVYEPQGSSSVVDILFVHGLQGHPFKTWTRPIERLDTPTSLENSQSFDNKEGRSRGFRNITTRLRRISLKAAPKAATEAISTATEKDGGAQSTSVFWPADLLPEECPNSRILVFGYDSKITKYAVGAINENSILSHSKDLLFALSRERKLDRPLICVAHSLGGIIIKEMLVKSSLSKDSMHKNIVESAAAVVFLGTPHRGSPDVAALGELVRSFVRILGMETTPAILDALGLKTTDLERVQEEFSRVWKKYDFRIKTFQEGLNLAKIGKKVVPDYSSLLGDYREHAETLQANHLEMCRYSGIDDPNYRRVAGELYSIYHSITRLNAQSTSPRERRHRRWSILGSSPSAKSYKATSIHQGSEALQSLWFPNINSRQQGLEIPVEQTCQWLFSNILYQDWLHGRNRDKHNGLLWLKGKPGAGKSTLVSAAFRQVALGQAKSECHAAAFFFNAKGDELEHSPVGLLRSLLYQLLPGEGVYLQHFQQFWDNKNSSRGNLGDRTATWQEVELRDFFRRMYSDTKLSMKKTLIFIDALDECDSSGIRTMAYFWRQITTTAYHAGVDLNICISSRHFPSITVSNCPEIIVEQHNSHDIAIYVEQRLQLGIVSHEVNWKLLRDNILDKSAGVFLWVVLVVDDMLKSWDDGKDVPYLIRRVQNVPEALETLFSDMFSSLSRETRELTARFFQWAVLATKPLRLHEWYHIMAFIRQPAPASLGEWRTSDHFTENDDQLERQIRSLSKGLVEVKRTRSSELQDSGVERMSDYARAGSLDLEHGDTRFVQVIHESVRDFFLRSNGFSVLDPNLTPHPIGSGHLSIMATCLEYLNIAELDALVQARTRKSRRQLEQRQENRRLEASSSDGIHSNSSPALSSISFSKEPVRYRHTMIADEETRLPGGKLATGRENAVTTEALVSYSSTSCVDIVGWMAITQNFAAKSAPLDAPRIDLLSNFSDTSQSQVLEAYPALLSYATVRLFSHAQLAEADGADPSTIIQRFKDKATWDRWVALREDVPEESELAEYASAMDLDSWVRVLSGATDTIHQIDTSNLSLKRKESSRESSPQGSSRQAVRKKISVASFGSASSHNEPESTHNKLASPKFDKFDALHRASSVRRTYPLVMYECECCPENPKRFENDEALRIHQAEKRYQCPFCGKRFRTKDIAEQHQNSWHVRRHFWSCLNLSDTDVIFHESPAHPGESDICGYCGEAFPRSGDSGHTGRMQVSDQDLMKRVDHMTRVHTSQTCLLGKKFFRAHHFRQHLKHSHAGVDGTWMDELENAARRDETRQPETIIRH